MKLDVKLFRELHDCKYCLYFRNKCRAINRCILDYTFDPSGVESFELYIATMEGEI